MKRLILMRHAKSAWPDGVSDKDRPLNKRGERSAKALGDWLRRKGYVPTEVLVSSALRTRQTFDWLNLDGVTPSFRDDLYEAAPKHILAEVLGASTDTVLVIGHNPGMGALANALATTLEDEDISRYPTGATTVIDFEIERWDQLPRATPIARDFIIPRRLTD